MCPVVGSKDRHGALPGGLEVLGCEYVDAVVACWGKMSGAVAVGECGECVTMCGEDEATSRVSLQPVAPIGMVGWYGSDEICVLWCARAEMGEH